MPASRRDQHRRLPLAHLLLSSAVVIAAGAIAYVGYPYYRLAPSSRPFSPEHRVFGSAGLIGLSCGIAAALLFLSNLSYLARKSWRLLSRVGSLRSWLQWHVASGLLGALLVPLHAAFEVRSRIAETCIWSLAIVIITGLAGRYLVGMIPLASSGERMSSEAIEDEILAIIDQIRPAVKHDAAAVRILQRVVDSADSARLNCLTWRDYRRRLRGVGCEIRQLRHAALHSDAAVPRKLIRGALRRIKRFYRQAVAADVAGRVLDSWRIFHGVLAVLFVVALGVHIFAAIKYGYVRL